MKKLLYIIILIISFLIINSLVRSIYNLWQKHDLVSDAQQQLQKERNENEKLKDQLARVKRPDFVEEEARNKLFMVKSGEKIVLLGEEQQQGSGEEASRQKKKIQPWEEWIELFFAQK